MCRIVLAPKKRGGTQPKTSFWVCLVVLAMCAITGCTRGGVPTYRAGGRVVFADGTPLKGGSVEFRPVSSDYPISARAAIQPDGTFQLGTFKLDDGAVEGEHQVVVSVPPPMGNPLKAPPAIDFRFSRFETSGLRFTVSKDAAKNQFVIQVEPPKK